jgi:hypothetical protein
MPTNMYRTRDNRRILFMNIYPRMRSAALAFLGCNDDPTAIGSVIRRWDAFDLEEQANRAGLQATVVRSAQEFLGHRQLVASGQLTCVADHGTKNLLPTHTADFGPDLEIFHPGSPVLGGSDMIAAEMEKVVDLIVG